MFNKVFLIFPTSGYSTNHLSKSGCSRILCCTRIQSLEKEYLYILFSINDKISIFLVSLWLRVCCVSGWLHPSCIALYCNPGDKQRNILKTLFILVSGEKYTFFVNIKSTLWPNQRDRIEIRSETFSYILRRSVYPPGEI